MPHLKKIALVTGASRGIGQAIALNLGKKNITVIGTATTESGAENITRTFKENDIEGEGWIFNAHEFSSINKMLDAIQEKWGSISILINNAGITRDALLMRMKDEQWNDIIHTNLNSIFHLSRSCIKHMLKERYGRIISISSVVASMGNAGQTNYAATKAAIEGFSRSLAREIGKYGITINVVAPGFIDTDMTKNLKEEHKQQMLNLIPMTRLGTAQEIAAAVNFLASDEASYITGITLHVNGGMYMT